MTTMNIKPDLDVFISNYTLVDPEIYQLWIDGYSAQESVSVLQQRGVTLTTGATTDLLKSDVLDHYRTYDLLERLLHNPPKLADQWAFQIEPQTQKILIEKYYGFDDCVIRELLGKKLSTRNRKDLDEVSEKTGVRLKSCRRQFDNVKRIFKTVEELQGSASQNIQNHFVISTELAKKYAAVVFLACNRFETGKRRLQYLTFQDFYECAQTMMASWTCYEGTPGSEPDDTELDREFLLDLRELRILIDKEKEHKHLVLQKLRPLLLERTYQELESNFRVYSRALITLACNLHRARELRSLYVELVERYVEHCRQLPWSPADLKSFLSAYMQAALEMDILREAELKNVWERYMKVILNCLVKMYRP